MGEFVLIGFLLVAFYSFYRALRACNRAINRLDKILGELE